MILERHGYALLFQLAFLLTTVASIVIGGLWFNDLIAIIAVLVLGNSLVYCFRFIKILSLVGESAKKLWIPIIRNLPYSVLCGLPAFYAFKEFERSGWEFGVILGLFFISLFMSATPSLKMFLKARDR